MESLSKLTADQWREIVGIDAKCIIEAGSHDGSDTAVLLAAFPEAMIYCFEPDQRPLRRFYQRLKNHPRIVLGREALADFNGKSPWYASHGDMADDRCRSHFCEEMQKDWDASSSIMKPTGHEGFPPWLHFEKEADVAVMRLDTWLAQHLEVTGIDLLWADIQGAEGAMIAGGERVLSITRFLYIEVYDQNLTPEHNAPERLYEHQPYYRDLLYALPGWTQLGFYNKDSLLFRNDNATARI